MTTCNWCRSDESPWESSVECSQCQHNCNGGSARRGLCHRHRHTSGQGAHAVLQQAHAPGVSPLIWRSLLTMTTDKKASFAQFSQASLVSNMFRYGKAKEKHVLASI